MNKADLLASIAEKTGNSKKEIDQIIKALFATLTETLVNQEKIIVPQFGSFMPKLRCARKGRNPRTGEAVDIPQSISVAFKPAVKLKKQLNPR